MLKFVQFCFYFWQIIAISIPTDSASECSILSSTSSIPIPSDGKCDCTGDWTGALCNVCTSNESCEAAYGGPVNDPDGLYDNHVCNTNFLISTDQPDFQSWCETTNDAIDSALEGPSSVDFSYDSTTDLAHLDLIRYTEGSSQEWLQIFGCNGSNCQVSKSEDGNEVEYTCTDFSCDLTCNDIGVYPCTPLLRGIVRGVGASGGFTYRCNIAEKSCELSEKILNSWYKDVVSTNCQIGTCTKTLIGTLETDAFVPNAANLSMEIGNITDSVESVDALQIVSYTIASTLLGLILVVFGSTTIFMVAMRKYLNPSTKAVVTDASTEFSDSEKKTIVFHDVSYTLKKGKTILSSISGIAKSGEITAIMGPSGAGKSSLIDVLAMRTMTGIRTGTIYANGKPINRELKNVIGYVDQSDSLTASLTVFENLLFSALLRLPQEMPISQKVEQVNMIMKSLQLSDIANNRVGDTGARGISGGEKRRVSVGMELVNNPVILFLDEPTSGLDAYNASVLIQCLRDLALKTGTAVITSIHQPRTKNFYEFDHLIVLHHGECVYGGPPKMLNSYLANIGNPVPSDYNPADFMIDILFDKSLMLSEMNEYDSENNPSNVPIMQQNTEFCASSFMNSELYGNLMKDIDNTRSNYAACLKKNDFEIKKAKQKCSSFDARLWVWQAFVLSTRNIMVLKRNKKLLLFHLCFAVYFGLLMGVIYFDLNMESLASIQNRLGAFMLMLVFVSFTALSALPLFWIERSLYIHERSNRFYYTSAYFFSKVFFDLVPLRVIPALILGLISHAMMKLRPGSAHLVDFLISLVLVSSTAASINLILGILITNIMTAIFSGIVALIHFFMMSKLFINFDSANIPVVKVLNYVSYFNFAYEAMVQNELLGRTITDFAVSSGDGILEYLGFRTDTLHQNIIILYVYFFLSLMVAYIALAFGVKEKK